MYFAFETDLTKERKKEFSTNSKKIRYNENSKNYLDFWDVSVLKEHIIFNLMLLIDSI